MKDKKVFLHIDLAGMEVLKKEFGEAAVAALDWYDKNVNKLISKNNGLVYAHLDNIFSVIFASPEDAFSFILETGEKIFSEKWAGFGSLPLKIAAHYGEGELVTESYSGPGPSRSLALLKYAGAGNIFITKDFNALVKTSPGRNKVKEIGLIKLGDNFREEALCQVLFFNHHIEAATFTRSVRQDTNFVPQRISFTGRKEELLSILSVLRAADRNIVALTGAVGSGKTRLALQAALELRVDCVDGVYHVDLSYVKDVELVPILVAEALKAETDTDFSSYRPEDRLITLLNVRKVVLVLDGIDELLDLNLITDKLIAECPNLKIITTSVFDKKISHSTVFKLKPLEFPKEDVSYHSRMTSEYPAVEFVFQAAFVLGIEIDKSEKGIKSILNICRKLQGNPYSIELFIANDRNVETQSFPAEIEKAGGSVNSVIKYVCERSLSPKEKEFIALVSVFSPSFNTVDASELSRLSGLEVFDVVMLCEKLYEKGVLFRMTVPDGAVRFYLNHHIRAYVQSSNGDKLKVYQPLYENYLASLAKKYYAEEDGKNRIKFNGMMFRRMGNFRQYLAFIIAEKHTDEARTLILSLAAFWKNNKCIYEGLYWLSRIFKVSDFKEHGYERRYLLFYWAWFFNVSNKKEEFYIVIQQADKESLDNLDFDNMARVRSQVGWRYYSDEKFDKALEEFLKILVFFDKIKDPLLIADIYADLAAAYDKKNDKDKFLKYLNKKYSHLKENDLRYSHHYSVTLTELEAFHLNNETQEEARQLAADEKCLAAELGDKIGLAKAARTLGNIERRNNNNVKAMEHFTESLSLFREAGNVAGTGSIMLALHGCNYSLGNFAEALDELLEALKIFYEINDWVYLGRGLFFAGRVYQKLGFDKKAAFLLGAHTAFSRSKTQGNMDWDFIDSNIEVILREIRPKLEQAEFAVAWMDGYKASVEEALREAVNRKF